MLCGRWAFLLFGTNQRQMPAYSGNKTLFITKQLSGLVPMTSENGDNTGPWSRPPQHKYSMKAFEGTHEREEIVRTLSVT